MEKSKFKVGDKVIVIKLDQDIISIEYDFFGEEYAACLYKIGTIVETKHTDRNAVSFSTDEIWYFSNDELLRYDENTNIDHIKLLYGKKI